MEHLDEHEMLVEYSEMTAFDFNSEEFRKVKNDYIQCKNFVSKFILIVARYMCRIRLINNY